MSAVETLRPVAPSPATLRPERLPGGEGPLPTVRLAPPDPVASVWRLRAERAALMGRVDALDEALRSLLARMTPD